MVPLCSSRGFRLSRVFKVTECNEPSVTISSSRIPLLLNQGPDLGISDLVRLRSQSFPSILKINSWLWSSAFSVL